MIKAIYNHKDIAGSLIAIQNEETGNLEQINEFHLQKYKGEVRVHGDDIVTSTSIEDILKDNKHDF